MTNDTYQISEKNEALISKVSGTILDNIELMLSELSDLLNKHNFPLDIDIAVEFLSIYIGFNITTVFSSNSAIKTWLLAVGQSQEALTNQFTNLFVRDFKEDLERTHTLIKKETDPALKQAMELFIFIAEKIIEEQKKAEDLEELTDEQVYIKKFQLGPFVIPIMEKCLNTTWQTLNEQFNDEQIKEFLLIIYGRVVLPACMILYVYFESTPAKCMEHVIQYIEHTINNRGTVPLSFN